MSKYDKIFYLGYQTPEMICFTRDSKDVKGSARLEDEITFKETMQFSIPSQDEKFIYQNAYLSIYIHYPGQLIKSLDTPRFSSSFLEYRWNDILEFKLSQGTLLRKRSNSKEPCRVDMEDYDLYLMETVCKMKNIQCIPPFWNRKLEAELRLENCVAREQLKEISNYIKNLTATLTSHDVPCIEMYNSIVWNWNKKREEDWKAKDWNKKQAVIKFLYQEQYYEEIQYLKAFDVEGFISNLGGFVGIFLGYSMMQLPELLGKLLLY